MGAEKQLAARLREAKRKRELRGEQTPLSELWARRLARTAGFEQEARDYRNAVARFKKEA